MPPMAHYLCQVKKLNGKKSVRLYIPFCKLTVQSHDCFSLWLLLFQSVHAVTKEREQSLARDGIVRWAIHAEQDESILVKAAERSVVGHNRLGPWSELMRTLVHKHMESPNTANTVSPCNRSYHSVTRPDFRAFALKGYLQRIAKVSEETGKSFRPKALP